MRSQLRPFRAGEIHHYKVVALNQCYCTDLGVDGMSIHVVEVVVDDVDVLRVPGCATDMRATAVQHVEVVLVQSDGVGRSRKDEPPVVLTITVSGV